MIQFDERDIMFSRMGLVQGTKKYMEYYKRHPELEEEDNRVREVLRNKMGKKMGVDMEKMQKRMAKMQKAMKILSKLPGKKMSIASGGMPMMGSKNSDEDIVKNTLIKPVLQSASIVNSEANKKKVAKHKVNISPDKMSTLIKEIARYNGADLVGIVELKNHHLYSYRGMAMGMGSCYGEKISLSYKYAIVVAAELKKDYINRAPHTEEILATLRGYADSTITTAKLVSYIKGLGYEAETDNFMKYNSPIVVLAREAGIGELGRSNMIVSKEFGNRLKMGAVLTNLPLIEDGPIDFGLTEFCELCGKCARNCPAKAINNEKEPEIIDGVAVWKHKETKCMEMWAKVGTDCGICMSSCPFSQGVNPELMENMKGNKEVMKKIIKLDEERNGKRAYIKEELDIVKLKETI